MTYEQIHNLFKQRYNQNNWKQFLGEAFAQARLLAKPEILTGIDSNVAAQVQKLGYITLNENGIERQIAVYEVTLAQGIILERNRVGLRNLLRKYWKDIDAAFIAYHRPETPNWRFTYVSELTGYDADGEFVKIKTEPKRYTYVLGEGESTRTAAERFTAIATKGSKATLDDVKEAFSVEKLSKAFFDEYKKHYDIFCDFMVSKPNIRQAIFNGDEKGIRDFNKKLLGRIVFLYFIQKKGWLGVPAKSDWGKGDFDFLSNLFKNTKNPDLFYSELLSKLFFDTLNTKRKDDLIELVKGEPCRIPYLNGGLFEEDDQKHRNLIFPANLFKNLFDFFNQYNFTIYEDDPNDHTVAVDPEMLGHIFENLLEDNKDKGAFYTPKEIVHYMCQESLIEYLKTNYELGNKNDELKPEEVENLITDFIKKKEINIDVLKKSSKSNESYKAWFRQLNDALDNVKICDPAIGSGAFPMGLLHEIFTAKQTLHTFEHGNTKTFDASGVKLNIIQNSIYGVDIEKGAVDIARLRFWLSLIVDEPEPKALPNLDYKIVVGNSLVSKLGDDIIDIDWTLNEISHGLFGADLAKQKGDLLKKISNEQKEFFNPDSDKKKLAADIRKLKIDLLITQLELMISTKGIETKPSLGKKIKEQTERYLQTIGWKNSIKDLQKLKNKPELPLHFFDWKLDFPEVMNPLVFDNKSSQIVVANEQILALNKQIDAINTHLEQHHIDTHLVRLQTNIAQGQMTIIREQLTSVELQIKEIFGKIITIEKGIVSEPDLSFIYNLNSINKGIEEINQRIYTINQQIEKQNPNVGFDIVIGNPPYVNIANLKDDVYREYLKTEFKVSKNKTDLYAFFLEKGKNLLKEKATLTFIIPNSWLGTESFSLLRKMFIEETKLNYVVKCPSDVFDAAVTTVIISFNNNLVIENEVRLFELKNKEFISTGKTNYETIRNKVSYGFSFNDEVKIKKCDDKLGEIAQFSLGIKTSNDKRFIFDSKKNKDCFELLRGKDFNRYSQTYNDKWIWYRPDLMMEKSGAGPRKKEIFTVPEKILIKDIAIEIQATIDREQYFTNDTINIIYSIKKYSIEYVTAILNSTLINKWFKNNFEAGLHIKINQLSHIPLVQISKASNKKIAAIVNSIINQKVKGKDTTSLEQEIDNLVYRLYDLTYDEVKVIDPAFSLSKKEYEAIKLE